MTITSVWIFGSWGGVNTFCHRLVDQENNIFEYICKLLGQKEEEIILSCKVTKNFTKMGKVINKINLR